MADAATRFDIQLDERHARKLRDLAERTHIDPDTAARSLLSKALDEVEGKASSVVDVLDSIPGTFERANEGLRQIRGGEGTPLDEF